MTNRFKQCPKCEQRITKRSSRDMLPDGTRVEFYRVCKHCGHVDTIIVKQEFFCSSLYIQQHNGNSVRQENHGE